MRSSSGLTCGSFLHRAPVVDRVQPESWLGTNSVIQAAVGQEARGAERSPHEATARAAGARLVHDQLRPIQLLPTQVVDIAAAWAQVVELAGPVDTANRAHPGAPASQLYPHRDAD